MFALHPVCVESVAWISEQKNTLSAVFYLGAALLYLDFDRTRRRHLYSWALSLFVLALLTKTVTATLPAALLVVFWWCRGRLEWRRDVLPLLPWFGAAAAGGLFTAWVEAKFIGAEGADFSFTVAQRVFIASRNIVFYMKDVLWPGDLMFIYPRWSLESEGTLNWLCLAGVLALAVVLVALARRRRGPLAGFLYFAGTLFPALGFVNVYPFLFSFVADHFVYLASIGIIVPATWGLSWAAGRLSGNAGRLAVTFALPVALGCLTWRQSRIYSDPITLYRSTLDRNPAAWLAHFNLAVALGMGQGHLPEAISEYEATVKLKPDHWRAHNNLGSALLRMPGSSPAAIAEFEEALRYNPNYAEAHNNLGVALERIPGRLGEAEGHLREAVRILPDYDAAHSNLGILLLKDPRTLDEALGEFEAAIRIAPGVAEYHYERANALRRKPGRLADAVSEYRESLRLRPDYPEAHSNLGVTLSRMPGQMDGAIMEFETAIKLDPQSAQIHANLADALTRVSGRKPEALDEYSAAIRIDPSNARYHYGLGQLLAGTQGGVPDAVSQLEEAVRLDPQIAEAHYVLGLCLAFEGKRDEAISQFKQTLAIRPDFEAARKSLRSVENQR